MEREGHDLIGQAYREARVGGDGCLRPENVATLEAFQDAFAAAQEWESLGLIKVVDGGEADRSGTSVILPIRFRRVR